MRLPGLLPAELLPATWGCGACAWAWGLGGGGGALCVVCCVISYNWHRVASVGRGVSGLHIGRIQNSDGHGHGHRA
jgi:hypothetical protein